ncbi:MAG: iron ABC transporter permease [Pseudoclavibacter sp.]|nr:iron ABC transporter permease [Pseudoclavibacter sp.]
MLLLVVPLVCLLAVGLGQLPASPGRVLGVLLGDASDPTLTTVVWRLRLPRVLLGLCVGAALAASGCALQAIVRNDLADPYLLGISSGASLGAALAIVGGLGALAVGAATGAFAGALLALLLVLFLLGGGRRLSGSRLVLSGLTVGYFLAALTNLVVVLSDDRDAVRAVTFWMLGSLSQASWQDLPAPAVSCCAALLLLVLWARRLDAVGLGDDVARSLGTDPRRLRGRVAIVSAIAVAAAVSVSGSVGFVGLVVPHLARRLVGAGHRLLLPACALLGAVVLVLADALARTVLAPREIPLGVLTALVGTPMLMLLLRRHQKEGELG